MPLNAQQLAAQKNLSYVLAEKLAQRILKGEYAPGAILPGEIELGDQFGVSRTAVREAVKTLTAKGMVLPRPRIGTRVMPQANWNFLDQELLTWWMTEDNFPQVIKHFLVMRISMIQTRIRQFEASAPQHADGRDGRAEKKLQTRTLD